MADLVVETPEGLALRFPLAGAGSRSAAALVDAILWASGMFAALVFFQVLLGGVGGLAVWVGAGAIVSLVSYHALFAILWRGRTPGKRLMGLRVVDQDGLAATPLQHVLRSLFWPFEAFVTVPVPLGVVLMAATPHHQRLGDRVAGTLVLRDLAPSRMQEPLASVEWASLGGRTLELVPAQAARFDGDDLELLRELLGRPRIEPAARERLYRRAATHYADRLELTGDERPGTSRRETRRFLGELYVFLRDAGGVRVR